MHKIILHATHFAIAIGLLWNIAHAQPLSQVRNEKKKIQTLLKNEKTSTLKKTLSAFTLKSLQEFLRDYDIGYKKKQNQNL